MNSAKSNSVKVINDSEGHEVAMVRVDKTLKRITVEEKPFSRWDVNYWHPKWADIIDELLNSKISVKYLYKLFSSEEWLIATDHVRASKKEHEGPQYPVEYYSPAGFYVTGYDIYNIPRCTENAYERMKRGQVKQYDLLLGGFGMGPTGKSVLLLHQPAKKAIVGNIFVLRTQRFYNSCVLDVFFKTKYGQAQFNKYKTGVAFNSLSNDEIKYLYVPLFKEKIIHNIEFLYKKMYVYHDKAMEAKSKNDECSYKKNIERAEKMLKDLIDKTEAVIQGKRKDIL